MRVPTILKRLRPGRRRGEPQRETRNFPNLALLGQPNQSNRVVYKPTPRNLRYFGRTVYGRRAINTIKSPVAMLDWEIRPKKGIELNSELERQIEIATRCLDTPNEDDSFRTLIEKVVEDILHGAGAIEQEIGGDPLRPLWLWPVDGLSIQIYPGWAGNRNEARYRQTIGYGSYAGGGAGVDLTNEELIYFIPNPTTSMPFGVGALEVAFNSISRQLGVGEYAGNVSTNAQPSSMLYLGDDASESVVSSFRSYWRSEIEGQGTTPIVGGTMNPEVLKITPDGDTALYLKYQEFLKVEIATAFDISPQNLGVERDVNRNTAEVAEDRDWDAAIKPMARLVSSHLTREAINARLGFSQLEHVWTSLDREDEEATAKIHKLYYEMNSRTPNESRALRGEPPLEGQWGDLTKADIDIAIAAARGSKIVDDDALNEPPAPEGRPKKGR